MNTFISITSSTSTYYLLPVCSPERKKFLDKILSNNYLGGEITDIPVRNSKPLKTEKEVLKPRKLSTSKLVTNNSDISTKEIDEKLSEYIVKGEGGVYTCEYCGKTARDSFNMRRHVETHMEGLSFPCQSCDKIFRSRHSLATHKSKYHRF